MFMDIWFRVLPPKYACNLIDKLWFVEHLDSKINCILEIHKNLYPTKKKWIYSISPILNNNDFPLVSYVYNLSKGNIRKTLFYWRNHFQCSMMQFKALIAMLSTIKKKIPVKTNSCPVWCCIRAHYSPNVWW